MIKYKLTCKDCDTSFDSWFASSGEYEKLKKILRQRLTQLVVMVTLAQMIWYQYFLLEQQKIQ